MKMMKWLLPAGLVLGGIGLFCAHRHRCMKHGETGGLCACCQYFGGRNRFRLDSPQLGGSIIPDAQLFYDCNLHAENISPELVWQNAPAGTQSFAVTMYDPDAPTGSGWWHWVMFDIPATVNRLPLNAGRKDAVSPHGAIQSLNDYGFAGYGGPCPPIGDKPHRYIFTVYALGVPTLGLDKDAMPASVGFTIQANKIAEAKLMRKYGR